VCNDDCPSAMNGCDHAGLSQRGLWATGPFMCGSVVKWAIPKAALYGALRYILACENFRLIDNFIFFSSLLFPCFIYYNFIKIVYLIILIL
jgi:hypothetical protein